MFNMLKKDIIVWVVAIIIGIMGCVLIFKVGNYVQEKRERAIFKQEFTDLMKLYGIPEENIHWDD